MAGHGGNENEPEPGCMAASAGAAGAEDAAAGCLTTQVPVGTFLIEPTADRSEDFCNYSPPYNCSVGPWFMTFRTVAEGQLEGALVAAERYWTETGAEAASFHLQANDHGVYELSRHETARLATYRRGWLLGPGLCLHNTDTRVVSNVPEPPHSELRFYDLSGDGIADSVTLRGTALTQAYRGDSFDDANCGEDLVPLHTSGRLIVPALDVTPTGDAMHPRLLVNGGFLSSGDVYVGGAQATPLTLAGFIYGFEGVALQPGQAAPWRLENGLDLLGQPLRGGSVPYEVEGWPLLTDGSFESSTEGETFGNGTVQTSYVDEYDDQSVIAAIEGSRSLLIVDPEGHGGGSHFRLERSAGQTHLSFVARENLFAEAASVGAAPPAFKERPLDARLTEYSVELEPNASDVLLSIYDHTNDIETGHHPGVWVDSIRLE